MNFHNFRYGYYFITTEWQKYIMFMILSTQVVESLMGIYCEWIIGFPGLFSLLFIDLSLSKNMTRNIGQSHPHWLPSLLLLLISGAATTLRNGLPGSCSESSDGRHFRITGTSFCQDVIVLKFKHAINTFWLFIPS